MKLLLDPLSSLSDTSAVTFPETFKTTLLIEIAIRINYRTIEMQTKVKQENIANILLSILRHGH